MSTADDSLERRVADLADRVAALEQQGAGGGGAGGDTASLRRSLNGLRREHRDLKETVEDEVVAYLREERDVLDRLQERVQEYGEIMREIKRNREHIATLEADVSEELDRLDRAVEGKTDVTTFTRRVGEVADELEQVRRRMTDRLNKLESRLDFMDDEE